MQRRDVHIVGYGVLGPIERFLWMMVLGSLLGLALGASAYGAETQSPEAAPPSPTPSAVVAIPLPEVAERAETVLRLLIEMQAQAQQDKQIPVIEQDFRAKTAILEARAQETNAAIEAEVSIDRLREFEREWLAESATLTKWIGTVTERANWFERKLAEIDLMRGRWEATRTQAWQTNAPRVVIQRIDETLVAIQTTRSKLEQQWTPVLTLQNHLSIEKLRTDHKLDEVHQVSEQRRLRFFQLDAPPIWRAWPAQDQRRLIAENFLMASQQDWQRLKTFWEDQQDRVEVHVLILFIFFSVTLFLRLRLGEEAQAMPGTEELLHVVRRPVSTALLAALFLTPSLYPYAPRVVLNLVYLMLLIPVIRLLAGLLHQSFRPFLLMFALFFILDTLRFLIEALPLLSRVLLLVETLGALGILVWLMRPDRLIKVAEGPRIPTFVSHGMRVALVLLSVSTLGNLLGAYSLAKSFGNGVFASIYAAVGLYAGMRVLQLLMISAVLRFRAVNKLHMVRNHRSKLIRRGMRLIRWVAVIVWFLAALRSFSIEGEILTGLRDLTVASVQVGTIQISLGNILGFLAAIYGARLLSRGLSFVLEEEIFKRVVLGRGVANAITASLRYVVWFLGGILALGAAGIDMSKFSLLAGALGVGIGFGLQNVVNNFVSGLILLYERPIQVGDTIEATDGIIGNVKRIGIRSSTVRTWEGAELIVPNANLISEKVTNWTLSDRLRRIDLPVGVAYGTNPKRVIELLSEVASSHTDVLADPPPEIFFTGFGDSSLDFVMRFWTGEFSRYLAIRSEVAMAVYDALEAAEIQVPFPQRDLHLRSVDPSISFKPDEKA